MNKENGSITLGELANIIFQLLGTDYFENKGISSNIRKRYISEKDISYEKYNLSDKKNELAKEIILFTDKLIIDFKVSKSIKYILNIPYYLSLNYKYFYPEIIEKKTYITYALKLYINFLLQTERISESTLESTLTETYSSIIKKYYYNYHVKVDLSEQNHTWKTVSQLMEEIIEIGKSSNDEKHASEINTKIIRHYLYLNLISSLKENFQIEGIQENIKNSLAESENTFSKLQNYPYLDLKENIFPQLWSFLDSIIKEEYFLEKNNYNFNASREICSSIANDYFTNTLAKIEVKEANRKLESISQLKPSYNFLPYYYWMKARTLIFQLEFPLNNENKEKYEQILKHFEEAFNSGKYVFGSSLGEFLEDAIAAENYLNPKNKIKDKTIENSQDNLSKRISINNENAKKYWNFGYATGHLSETSKQTYLFAYKNKENFWNSFIVNKFISKTALKQKQKDLLSEELIIPLHSTLSPKTLLDKLQSNRKKLSPDLERFYSRLSLAIINIENFYIEDTEEYDELFLVKIKEMSNEKIAIYDENGAPPLIRALYEYKKTRYGFTIEFQRKRADLFSKFHLKQNCLWDDINHNFSKEIIRERNEHLHKDFINSYIPIIEENYKNFDYKKNKIKQDFLKKIILILIEKYDSNQLLAEAIELDYLNCVSALQLAIDSYDFELVDLIISKIPQKHKLHEILISNEYLNPLQYAIRKYDLLDFNMKENSKKSGISKKLREIPNRKLTTTGITEESRAFNKNKSINNLIKDIDIEQTGFFIPNINIFKSYLENMSKIVKKLADKTEYISVDTMYYLADANNPINFEELIQYIVNENSNNDILELAKYIIKTKKVDVARSNYDFDLGYFPKDTILATCIRIYNFKLLKIILEDEFCSEKLKSTLNQIVKNVGWDSKGNRTIVKSTDIDFYFAQVCHFFDYYHEYKKHSNLDNQKQEKHIIILFKEILFLFYKLGARFDIKDQQGKTTAYFMQKRLDEKRIPKELIPEEIIKEYGIKI